MYNEDNIFEKELFFFSLPLSRFNFDSLWDQVYVEQSSLTEYQGTNICFVVRMTSFGEEYVRTGNLLEHKNATQGSSSSAQKLHSSLRHIDMVILVGDDDNSLLHYSQLLYVGLSPSILLLSFLKSEKERNRGGNVYI